MGRILDFETEDLDLNNYFALWPHANYCISLSHSFFIFNEDNNPLCLLELLNGLNELMVEEHLGILMIIIIKLWSILVMLYIYMANYIRSLCFMSEETILACEMIEDKE